MSFLERAQTILLLKESLGEFYEEQKQAILVDVLALPLPEAAPLIHMQRLSQGRRTSNSRHAQVSKLNAYTARAASEPRLGGTIPYKFLRHVIKPSSEGYYQLIVGAFPKLMKRLVSDVRLNICPLDALKC